MTGPDPAVAVDALARGTFAGSVALVVAHPDDETVSLGGLLQRLHDPTLIHVTDGAPEDMADALRLGFATREAYRRARATELDAALAELGARIRRLGCGLADQATVQGLSDLTRRLSAALAGADLAITHAYEGGHPDHDSCAFAVQAACALLARSAKGAPVRVEFPSYHQERGRRAVGRFHPDPSRPESVHRLSDAQLSAKRRALARHQSQAEVLAWFEAPELERFRAAPEYDFTRPPPPGEALYDGWGWPLTSAVWRERAAAALRSLGLAERAA